MSKLDNYLRSSRRGAGLSQDEMAYLLGVRTGVVASRYERFKRRPALETALTYEAIFRTPHAELPGDASAELSFSPAISNIAAKLAAARDFQQ
jgi:transcriptional regulator with XRE-family HTH domain